MIHRLPSCKRSESKCLAIVSDTAGNTSPFARPSPGKEGARLFVLIAFNHREYESPPPTAYHRSAIRFSMVILKRMLSIDDADRRLPRCECENVLASSSITYVLSTGRLSVRLITPDEAAGKRALFKFGKSTDLRQALNEGRIRVRPACT